MEDPIKVWELSKDKTGLPVNLCVIDINEDYQDDALYRIFNGNHQTFLMVIQVD